MNKLLIFLVAGFFLMNFSAAASVDYSVYSAVIENNGVLTESNNAVNGFELEGYKCLDSNCVTLGPKIYDDSSSSNQITINFPTTGAKYVLYFHKDGYIGWEEEIYISGTADYDFPVYLSKKATGYAPIQNFNVVNNTNVNSPIVINLDVGIDADTYAAIVDNSQTGLDHNEFVETLVTLKIFDNAGVKIHEESTTLNIEYSGSESVSFDYTFTSVGNYSINLTTNVPDEKIINALEQMAGAVIVVVASDANDYSYTLLNGLSMSPLQPEANEEIDFSIGYLSRYVDEFGAVLPQNTSLDVVLYLNGTVYDNLDNILVGSDGVYYFSYSFPSVGTWKVVVEGNPSPGIGSESLSDIDFLEFPILSGGNNESNNETNGTWVYFANMTNLVYEDNLSVEDDLNISFDYEFYGEDGLGNYSDVNGSLFLEAFVNGTFLFDDNYSLVNNGTFNYIHNFTDIGNYIINFELCPSIVGVCETWSVDFSIYGNSDDDEDDDDDNDDKHDKRIYKNETKILTINSGFAIGNSTEIELGNGFENDTPSLLWIILLLLACILLLIAILLFQKDREAEMNDEQRLY